jgi:hypothetical protein
MVARAIRFKRQERPSRLMATKSCAQKRGKLPYG